jgi:hypothetical protein BACCOPRO_02477
LPASKSISNRVLLLNELCGNAAPIENLSECDDSQVMQNALSENGETIDIHGAGTAMRFLTAYFAIARGKHLLTGSERMRQRPIAPLVEALRSIGASIDYAGEEGFPPLHITGGDLEGGNISLPGDISSQYISALLMIAPRTRRGIDLTLTGKITSRPYIDMTVSLLRLYGATVTAEGNRLTVAPGNYQALPMRIEADWTAASYWYQIAALHPHAEIELPGLHRESLQGDARIAELFEPLGIRTRPSAEGIVLTRGELSTARIEYDLTDQPDLAQTLVATCALLGLPFRFTGLQSLRIKETDRITALKNELKKLGCLIADRDSSILEWNGERCAPQPDPIIDTYDDHRMAMAFAPAAIRFPELGIRHPEVVGKSYPKFWDHLQKAGFFIEQECDERRSGK